MKELQLALGAYLERWHQCLVPTTPALTEYASRAYATSVAWAPGRMVDAASEMLGAWRRNDNTGKTTGALLPVALVALAKDYVPVPGDHSRQIANEVFVTIPSDTKERIFKLRQIQGLRRGQILIAAAEEETARNLVQQLILFINAVENRYFQATYRFAGIDQPWPITVETTDIPAEVAPDGEEKNLTLLVVDVHFLESIPLFKGPTQTEPNDGQGDGTPDNPSGYPKVNIITIQDQDNGMNAQQRSDHEGPIFGAENFPPDDT
ncbi:hypothetical protein [Paraburkholderia domus]|uniref:hypothetical protein n=1 Tax=Paraburkholderia domus TaxID=2793075 RepID=UPI001911A367|nr:hypothetical protein [Paraburkholderia domus]MBK5061839.1 hypothetical protein [Burkholderia sp. R-70199]CAE6901448.1 hypothetical protein R70199_03719 [Paraburkholderia domus]